MISKILFAAFALTLAACSVDAPPDATTPAAKTESTPAPESAPVAIPDPAPAQTMQMESVPETKSLPVDPGFLSGENIPQILKLQNELTDPALMVDTRTEFQRLVQDDKVEAVRARLAAGKAQGLNEKGEDDRLPVQDVRSSEMVDLIWDLPVVIAKSGEGRGEHVKIAPAYDIADGEGLKPFHHLALEGRDQALDQVMRKWCGFWANPALNAPDAHGRTMIMLAAIGGDLAAVDTLLDCEKVSLWQQDDQGKTALHYAVAHPDFAVGYALLRRRGLDILNKRDLNGESALDAALKMKNDVAIRMLRKFGAEETPARKP